MVSSEALAKKDRSKPALAGYRWRAITCSTPTPSKALPIPSRLYHGHSSDLKQRLIDHNAGKCPHTAKHLPWRVKFYAAFQTLMAANAETNNCCPASSAAVRQLSRSKMIALVMAR
jgi:predicted GIY-YIG superfamily endonuclease